LYIGHLNGREQLVKPIFFEVGFFMEFDNHD